MNFNKNYTNTIGELAPSPYGDKTKSDKNVSSNLNGNLYNGSGKFDDNRIGNQIGQLAPMPLTKEALEGMIAYHAEKHEEYNKLSLFGKLAAKVKRDPISNFSKPMSQEKIIELENEIEQNNQSMGGMRR